MSSKSQFTAETTKRPTGARAAMLAAAFAALLVLPGCSTVSDAASWANPLNWFGDDDPVATQQATKPATAATDERFPNLGRVPPRPVEQSSSADRRQAMGTLAADRSNARYTDEELRARPATGNQVPPAPAAPQTQLPGVPGQAQGQIQANQQLQGGAVPAQQMQRLAAGRNDPVGQRAVNAPAAQAAPQQPGYQAPAYQAPAYQAPANAANMGSVYAANLQASAATVLPPNLAQSQPQLAQPAAAPLAGAPASASMQPGGRQLLAVVRFPANSATLDARDRTLLKNVADYQKGIGGKGRLRVVGFASATAEAADTGGKRAQTVAAELQKHYVAANMMTLEARAEGAPAYYQAAAGATAEQSRRVEIYLEN
jgi:outer membrane protein OmpA-like peptidoglycan-associated protein